MRFHSTLDFWKLALVGDNQRSWGRSPDATKGEFPEQGTLVDFFEESGAESIANLKDRANHTLGQPIEVSVFIGVHRWPILTVLCRHNPAFLGTIIGHR